MLKRIDHFFRSIRVAVAFLLLISGITALGAFPKAVFDATQYSHPLAATIIQFFSATGLSHPMQSWWYIGLLALLAVMMAYCAAYRALELNRRQAGVKDKEVCPEDAPISAQFNIRNDGPIKGILDRLGKTLRFRGYRVMENGGTGDGQMTIRAHKGTFGLWGAVIVHMGLVLVLVGGLLTHLFGHFEDVEITEGRVLELPGTDTRMMLGKFSVLFDEGPDQPSGYVSRFFVDRPGQAPEWKELRVNGPLLIDGVKMFQMRYRFEIREIELETFYSAEPRGMISLVPAERQSLPGSDLKISIGEFAPDFVIGLEGQVGSRTPYLRNPAVELLLSNPNQNELSVERQWAFLDMPPNHQADSGGWSFIVKKIRKQYISGIKLSRDPGVPFAYLGFLILCLGSFCTSFLIPRHLSIRAEGSTADGMTTVNVMGGGCKDMIGFRREFSRLVTELERKLA